MSERTVAVVARIARLLNAGDTPDATLIAVAGLLRAALEAEHVVIWRRAGADGFVAAASSEGSAEPAFVAALELVPAGGSRIVLRPADSAAPFGLLQVLGAERDDRAFLGLVADLLSPYLGSLRLSEDRVSEAAEQSRAMDEARRFTELIIDSLPVGLYAVDRDYRIQVWNRKRETGTQGLRRGAVVGRTVFEVLTRQPVDQLRAEFDRVFKTGEVVESEMEVETPEGARIYRLTRIPMRLEGDTITHVITIGEDVSDWRDVQAHILQSEKLAALGQLAAGIMHEINNPLATIAACVAAGEGRLAEVEGRGLPALREYLAIIDREVVRCTSIVDGLLDFSRPKGTAKTDTDVNRLVEEALGLLRHHKRFKAMTVTRELAEGLPLVVVNGEQIVQVLMALTINALDAMEGGGRLAVRTARSRRNADEIVVEVEDTGPGVASELRSKIFEPFFTTKPPGRGTGLGLSICYGIVEEHRGRIEVDGGPVRGATFRVYLPTAPAPEAGVKILVVEDDRTVGQYVKRGLDEHGFHADLVDDGLEGLRLASGGQYDLLVLDLRLPGMTGLEVLRTLRDRGNTVPILVLTAQDALDFKVQALRSGADDYVTKPFAFEELLARVEALGRRPQQLRTPVVRIANLELDTATREVRRSGEPIELTPKEYTVLEYLMRHSPRVMSRTLITEYAWDYHFDPGTNIVDVVINRIRKKVDSAHAQKLVHTVRGVGYVVKA